MKRRKFIKETSTAALAGGLPIAGSAASATDKIFIHHVYFWLADPESKEDKEQLIAALKKLAKVSVIKEYHIGIPASTSRDVIDGSYQVSWCLFFKSAEEEKTYQSHPLHLQFIEENKHLWSKVVVYDSIDV